MDYNSQLAIISGGVVFLNMINELVVRDNKRKHQRRFWVRNIFKKRDELGHSNQLVKEMVESDIDSFYNFTRMSPEQFEKLLLIIGPKIEKHSFRKPLSARERLLITLRFLATGDSYGTLSFAFRTAKSTIHNIIAETAEVIWQSLQQEFLSAPSEAKLKEIARQFYHNFKLPNCVGAIDGKHCVVQAPPHSGSLYYNYKKQFSIVLLAVCDADCNFIYCDIGAFGSESDGGVLQRSDFGRKFLNNELDFSEDCSLPGTNIKYPHYIIGDEAFALKKNLIRPYGGRNLPSDKRTFNERISKTRRLIENSFGILASRFRIYHRTIIADVEVAKSIIKASVVLHNYIRKTATSHSITEECQNVGNLTDISQQGSNHPSNDAMDLRNILKDWVNENSS